MGSEIICSKCGRNFHHCKCPTDAAKLGVQSAPAAVAEAPLKPHPFDGTGWPVRVVSYPRHFETTDVYLRRCFRLYEVISFTDENASVKDRLNIEWVLDEVVRCSDLWREVEVRAVHA